MSWQFDDVSTVLPQYHFCCNFYPLKKGTLKDAFNFLLFMRFVDCCNGVIKA